jgi:hypothetical protein
MEVENFQLRQQGAIMIPDRRKLLLGGLVSGLIGYGTVVVVTAVLNLVAARSPFHTAALFGSTLFYGLEDPQLLQIAPGPVLAYNGAHVVAFLVLGMVCAWAVYIGERYPVAQWAMVFALIFVGFHVFAALVLFAQPLLGTSAWWQIGIASVCAAVTMGYYFWRTHPVLRRELQEIQMGEVPGE